MDKPTGTISDAAKQGLKKMVTAFLTNGVVEDGSRLKVKDMLVSTDATIFMPKVIQTVVKQAIEPVLVISKLFQTVRLASGQSISYPAVGAITADLIPEGTDYPEKTLEFGGAQRTKIEVDKYGCRVAITEEAISESQWDIIGMHLEAAGRALARKKETVCAEKFATFGFKVFDNLEPSAAVIGQTTGRSISGAADNGAFHLDDIFDMYAYLLHSGWNPNRLLMHPLSWLMMAKDPILRELAWTANKNYWGGMMQGKTAETGWDDALNLKYKTMNPNASTTATVIPSSVFPTPLGVTVSPYVRYIPKGAAVKTQADGAPGATIVTDASSLAKTPLTDVYLMDDSAPGIIVQRDEVNTEQFDEPARDIRNLKIRERYGIGVLNQGKGIAVARNVAVTRSYTFEPNYSITSMTEPSRNI